MVVNLQKFARMHALWNRHTDILCWFIELLPGEGRRPQISDWFRRDFLSWGPEITNHLCIWCFTDHTRRCLPQWFKFISFSFQLWAIILYFLRTFCLVFSEFSLQIFSTLSKCIHLHVTLNQSGVNVPSLQALEHSYVLSLSMTSLIWVLLEYNWGSPGPQTLTISLSLAMAEFLWKVALCLCGEGYVTWKA